MDNSISALLPFYNEEEEIVLKNLNIVSKLNGVEKIILIDDGSEKSLEKIVEEKFGKVKYLRLEKNIGKTGAIKTALEKVKTEYVFLMDTDLDGVKKDELQKRLDCVKDKKKADGLIFKRVKSDWTTRLQRTDLIFSGERLIKSKDLRRVFSEYKPEGFQLETAINLFWMEKDKKIYWAPHSGVSPHKIKKLGFLKGFIEDLKMDYSTIIGYRGLGAFLKQVFCLRAEKIE